jgi:hypothetical protein
MAIDRQLGIATGETAPLTGAELEQLDDAEPSLVC